MQSSATNLIFVLAAWGITNCLAADDSAAWNYIRTDSAKGPNSWAANFPECSKNRNSPVNFVRNDAVRQPAESWKLTGWGASNTWTVLDTHYTAKFSLSGAGITTAGGDLGGTYDVVQFHLHWGAESKMGSEHTVDGSSYPMEVHFVHVNSVYNSITEAAVSGADDALAAVGFFFEIQTEDNPKLAKIVDAVTAVRANTANYTIADFTLNALTDFVATDGSFYRYYGGLTTPGCQQIVKWTVFETPIKISEAQMAIIRDQTDNSYGTEFYRDVTPIGARTVTLYDPTCTATTCGAPASLAPLSALLLFSFITKYL